jgi:glycosyltransferase involved in cell wall biosynthesis
MYQNSTLSVVLPAYNERAGIAQAVKNFRSLGVVDEVIVVDNNSTDGTGTLAEEAGAKVVVERQQGYGYALRRGMAEASGDLIVLAEPDGTFVAEDVFKLLAYSNEVDMVLGTRTTRELIWDDANMTPFLRWGNWAVAKLLQVLFNTPSLSDCGCTLRLVHRSALERFRTSLTVGSSHFLPEMVIRARLEGLRILEVPVNYHPRVGTSKITGSRLTTLRVGTNMIRLILRYRFRGSPA